MIEQKTFEGLVVKSTGGLYTVETSDGNFVECRAKGSFRHEKITPLCADRVVFEMQKDGTGFITEICERKNSLIRPAAANIDLLCVVSAVADPEPDLYILDKLCAVAKNNNIEVLLVFNKDDLKNADELCRIYNNANFCALPISTKNIKDDKNKDALEKIRQKLSGKITFFTGASGVGKSSIINTLFPNLSLETGEISKKIQRGKHTTRVTTLFKIDKNTYIGDTPGFSMLDVVTFKMLEKETLLEAFPDISKFALDCKYKKCSHTCEDGCNVIKALNEGKIEKTRHESYVKLYNELKEVKSWMQ